jgi:hypothetical protein
MPANYDFLVRSHILQRLFYETIENLRLINTTDIFLAFRVEERIYVTAWPRPSALP